MVPRRELDVKRLQQTLFHYVCAERLKNFHAVRVELHISGPFVWNIGIHEDRFNWALGDTRAAVDAVVRVDVELLFVAVEAFTRADDDAVRVLASATRLGHDVGHWLTSFRVGGWNPPAEMHPACQQETAGFREMYERSDDAIWSNDSGASLPGSRFLGDAVFPHLAIQSGWSRPRVGRSAGAVRPPDSRKASSIRPFS